MSNNVVRLVLRYGKSNQPEYRLTERPVTIGREAINDIVLGDPEISRRHARMFVQDKKYFLEDLGSTNGTFINGQRVQMPTQVHDKDSVEFGESIRLQFLLSEPDEIDVPTPAIEVEYRVEPRLGPTKPLPGEPPPPPSVRPVPQPSDTDLLATMPEEAPAPTNWRRLTLGCGCLVMIVLFICALTLFILDSQFPNVLYCGPLRGFFDLLLPLDCPIL